MNLTQGLSTAVGGLANIDRQLALLAHNVSNASTAGYVRQIAVQTALTADGAGLGVKSGPAIRDVNPAMLSELRAQASVLADLETRGSALDAIDALSGTPGAGNDLASMLGQVRDAFSRLANDPADQVSQRAVVNAAQVLAANINAMSAGFDNQRQVAQDSAQADIDTLNQALDEIGKLSNQIIRLKSLGESVADLENQRDAAVSRIARLVEVKPIAQANGDIYLVSPSGLSLPTHGAPNPFSLFAANLQTGAWYPGGGVSGISLGGMDVTAQFRTGRIAANIALRDSVLPTYQAALDEFAKTLSLRFSEQGLALFTDPAGAVPPGGGVPVQSGYVGYAAIIQINSAVAADAALVRDGTHAVPDNPAGASVFILNPGGGPAGFVTLIQRVLDYSLGANARPDVPHGPANATGLGPGGGLRLNFNGSGTLANFVENLVSRQAIDSADTGTRLKAEQATNDALKARYHNTTGVDIDAEMAMMVQLQNAYGANARVISAVQAMWDQLLGAVR